MGLSNYPLHIILYITPNLCFYNIIIIDYEYLELSG